MIYINPCGAETRIIWEDKVSTPAADALFFFFCYQPITNQGIDQPLCSITKDARW